MSRHVIYTRFAVRRFRLFNVEIIGHVAHREKPKPSSSPFVVSPFSPPSLFLSVFIAAPPLDRQLRRLRSAPRANNRGRPFSFP